MVLIDKKDLGYAMKLGARMPAFSLPGTDGTTHSSDEFSDGIAVIAFWCNHCPYVIAAEPAFDALVSSYGDRVAFVAINSNEAENYPEDSFEKMKEKDTSYLYLRDESQEVANAYGAECTPHIFVFKDGMLVYQGRINDAGQDVSRASTHELRDALDELLAGKDVSVAETSAMGCSIKWR